MNQSTDQYERRAAIALNNMAVSMMERCCYRQGFETFKEAVAVMRLSVQCPTRNRRNVLKMLKRADQRSSKPSISMIFLHIRTVFSDAFQRPIDSPESLFSLIRIDSDDGALLEDEHENASDLFTIIMLYNLGISYLCRAKCCNDETYSIAAGFRSAGTRILELCRDLLMTQYENCEDPFLLLPLIFISTLVVEVLVQTLRASGRVQEAKSCLTTLGHLRRAARNLDNSSNMIFQQQVRAASAA